jgi:coenzyme F420-reducing hydrogenase alpha subunit
MANNKGDNMNKIDVTCYYFFITGLFGRNRKVKQDMFYVKRQSEVKLDLEQVKDLMNEKIKTLKPKGEFTIKLLEQNGTIENDSGVQIHTIKIEFNKKPLLVEKRIGV